MVAVSDGDTVTVLDPENHQHRVRLEGIDAPEKSQPFGQRSKESLSSLVYGQWVKVQGSKTDRYGRTVAKLWVASPDSACRGDASCSRSLDANLAQLTRGMAWWYRQYAREQSSGDRVRYAEAEVIARRNGVGLWQDREPAPPWEWRHRQRQGASPAAGPQPAFSVASPR